MALHVGDVYHDTILNVTFEVIGEEKPDERGKRWLVQPSDWVGPITMYEQAMVGFHRPDKEG